MYRVFFFEILPSEPQGKLSCLDISQAFSCEGFVLESPLDTVLDFDNVFCMHTKDDAVTMDDFAQKVIHCISEKRAILEHYIFMMQEQLAKFKEDNQ